jgi:hypothetical protein
MHTRAAYALAAVFVICGVAAAFAALHQPDSPTRGEKASRLAKLAKPEPMAALLEKPKPQPQLVSPPGVTDCKVFALLHGQVVPQDFLPCAVHWGRLLADGRRGPVFFGTRP